MRKTIYTVHTAQFYESSGELITFAKSFPSLEKAAKFVVLDFNDQCKGLDELDDKLSISEWKGIAQSRQLESPANWDGWIKWQITKQVITV